MYTEHVEFWCCTCGQDLEMFTEDYCDECYQWWLDNMLDEE